MCIPAEISTGDNRQPALDPLQAPRIAETAMARKGNVIPRWRKETLLPQVMQLALEGHSGETIARKVGLPSRTVRHWLKGMRQEWIAEAAGGAAQMSAMALARLNAIYREAMEAWRDSRKEIEVRIVEDVQTGNRHRASKPTIRTQSPRPDAAQLTRAMAAAKAMYDLNLRAAASLSQASEPIPASSPSPASVQLAISGKSRQESHNPQNG